MYPLPWHTTFAVMPEEYQQLLLQAKKKQKDIAKTISRLSKMRKGEVDRKIHPLHHKAFNHINCLACAHCCKTTGPLFTRKDITTIAKHLKLAPAEFIDRYLRLDEDNDYVLQSLPCTFLGEDNYCTLYAVRPKACREYPHTDRVNQAGILTLAKKNAAICPAVAEIFLTLSK